MGGNTILRENIGHGQSEKTSKLGYHFSSKSRKRENINLHSTTSSSGFCSVSCVHIRPRLIVDWPFSLACNVVKTEGGKINQQKSVERSPPSLGCYTRLLTSKTETLFRCEIVVCIMYSLRNALYS